MEGNLISKSVQTCASSPDPLFIPLEMTALGGTLRSHLPSVDVAQSSNTNAQGPRSRSSSRLNTFACLALLLLGPPLVLFSWIAVSVFDGALGRTRVVLCELGVSQFLTWYGPGLSIKAYASYLAWLLFQAGLYTFLPGNLSVGQFTPSGQTFKYRTNGLWAWTVTLVVFALACASHLVDASVIARNWGPLLVAANVYGFILSAFAYVKAYLYPTRAEDRNFSGSWPLDFFRGIELNPRFGKLWDLKFFSNGRPGFLAWTLIDISFTVYQLRLHGSISSSIIVADILHGVYVLDFFINEDWYLHTFDICHEHFGFFLAWGSAVWVPAIYTLQTQYLARRPIELNTFVAILILSVGLAGFVLYRSANHQKDLARLTKGECAIWGQKAEVIKCPFQTSDGNVHESLLLCSGWWRISRHMNYLGAMLLSLSTCAASGFRHLLPWTYALFMVALLLHRIQRVEQRNATKYGTSWSLYCANVKWKLIPGLY